MAKKHFMGVEFDSVLETSDDVLNHCYGLTPTAESPAPAPAPVETVETVETLPPMSATATLEVETPVETTEPSVPMTAESVAESDSPAPVEVSTPSAVTTETKSSKTSKSSKKLMIAWLTNATKRRVIQEIKKILYDHPRYRSDSENVRNKFAYDERTARGVIVNGTSGDRVRLSADNYMGRLSSFCMLVPTDNSPCTTVEWVRENNRVLENTSSDRSVFPSPPGVYRFEVLSVPDEARNMPGQVSLTSLLTVIGEPLIIFSGTGDSEAQLSRSGIYPNSVRLWLDGRRALLPGVDFSVDYESGAISFLKEVPPGEFVHADYRYISAPTGTFPFYKEKFDVDMIPGAILAFGDRCQECDKFSVVVTDERTDVADVYGGKFEINFDIIAFSKDSEDREKLSDYIVMKLLERQNSLGFEGLELLDISPGGENEEVFNPETDEYFYDSSISLSMRVDWSIYIPLPASIWRTEMTSKVSEHETGYLDGSFSTDLLTPDQLGHSALYVGNSLTFERITLSNSNVIRAHFCILLPFVPC